MAIKGPKGAHPTLRGWVNPNTGELLKVQRITQEQIDDFFGEKYVMPEPEVAPPPPITEVVEYGGEPIIEVNYDSMTKAQLVSYAAGIGLEVDSKNTKAMIIEQLTAFENA